MLGQDIFIPDSPDVWDDRDARSNKVFSDRAARQIMIVSAGRSGSSFLGDIVNTFPGKDEQW